MTKQEIIDWYQDRYANKDLSFGCITDKGIIYQVSELKSYLVPYLVTGRDYYIMPEIKIENFEKFDKYSTSYSQEYSIQGFEDGDQIKIIGHPLNRGRLVQRLYKQEIQIEVLYVRELENLLLKKNKLDATIYERVEVPEILLLLVELKELIKKE